MQMLCRKHVRIHDWFWFKEHTFLYFSFMGQVLPLVSHIRTKTKVLQEPLYWTLFCLLCFSFKKRYILLYLSCHAWAVLLCFWDLCNSLVLVTLYVFLFLMRITYFQCALHLLTGRSDALAAPDSMWLQRYSPYTNAFSIASGSMV